MGKCGWISQLFCDYVFVFTGIQVRNDTVPTNASNYLKFRCNVCLTLVVTEGYAGVQVSYPTVPPRSIEQEFFYRYSGDDGFSNSGVDLEVLVLPRSK